jgi:exosortase/archaeosortase family protein
LLWLVLPLPLGTDYQLITFLQLFSSRLSSTALDAIGVLHLMEGNTLLLVNKQLFVDEACSGIVSVMSIVACAAIYGVWQNRSLLHIVLLALLGIVWATLMNVLRIVIIAFVLNTWNIDWSAGTAHELLGLVLFLLAFAALATSDQLLLALLGPIEVAWLETTGHGLRYGRWLIRGFDRTASWGEPSRRPRLVDEHRHGEPSGIAVPVVAAVLFAALGLYQLALPSPTDRASAPVDELSDPNIARAMQIDRQSLPSSLLGLRCVDFRSEHRDSQHIMGEHSQVFSFSDQANLPVLVSCDFAYPGGWHELSVCYRGIGWELLSRRIVVPDTSASDRRWPIVELVLRKPDGSFAAVLFCAFDDKGQPIEPPAETLSESFETALSRRKQKSPRGNCFQVQVLLSSPTLPTGERLATGTQLLTAARQQLRDTIIDNKAGTAGTTDEP